MPREIDPQDASDALAQDAGAIYLDVRSAAEYAQGHAPDAWNIPILHASPQGMRPNADFAQVAAAVLPQDVLLIVGCKSGQRSAMACQALEQLGFTKAANLSGGFHGSTDPLGRVLAAGWVRAGLPTTSEPTPGRTWEELKASAAEI